VAGSSGGGVVSDTDRNPVGVAAAEERRDIGPGDTPGLEPFNALLRRMLVMPPKPHSEMKLGKPRRRGASRRAQGRADDKDTAL